MAGFRAHGVQDGIESLHGRLSALEALLVMVLSQRGPNALRAAIEDIRERAKITPPEDATELVALAARLNGALVAVEQAWDGECATSSD